MTRKSSYEVFSLTFCRMKTSFDDLRAFFRATKYLQTTSSFVPYEFFPVHRDISSEGCVWNLFG